VALVESIKRSLRRLTTAGVESIYEHEVAALQALHKALVEADGQKLSAQFARYDRIDRSPNLRKQKFIDDDSDFRRSDWPVEILFPDEGLVHSADILLKHRRRENLTVKAQAFLVWGRFDGFEFKFSRGKAYHPGSFRMQDIKLAFVGLETEWATQSVTLFTPFGPEPSGYRFVAAQPTVQGPTSPPSAEPRP